MIKHDFSAVRSKHGKTIDSKKARLSVYVVPRMYFGLGTALSTSPSLTDWIKPVCDCRASFVVAWLFAFEGIPRILSLR